MRTKKWSTCQFISMANTCANCFHQLPMPKYANPPPPPFPPFIRGLCNVDISPVLSAPVTRLYRVSALCQIYFYGEQEPSLDSFKCNLKTFFPQNNKSATFSVPCLLSSSVSSLILLAARFKCCKFSFV